jgi:hypothetical protein
VSEQRGRVAGLGGVFVKSRDPAGILAWYRDQLHVALPDFGAIFRWRDEHAPERRGVTVESKIVASADGRVARITDPDGTRVEPWEPPASEVEVAEVGR